MATKEYNQWAREVIDDKYWVGKIAKVYGLNGELVIRLGASFPDDIVDQPFWVEIDSLPVPLYINSYSTQGVSKAVVVFDDFQSEELAQRLIGLKLYSYQAYEDMDDEYEGEWAYLVGFDLLDLTSGTRAKIVDYIDNELNPLIVVELKAQGQDVEEHYVPIAQELIEKIDNKKRTISMKLSEGMFELQNSGDEC